MHRLAPLSVWILVSATALAGQTRKTITIADDLPGAVRTASAGTVIRLKPGRYVPAIVDKPLSIIGGPGVVIAQELASSFAWTFVVHRLGEGDTVTLRELRFEGKHSVLLAIASNRGHVALEGVELVAGAGNLARGVEVESTSAFSFNGCRVSNGLRVRGSSGVLTACFLEGRNAAIGPWQFRTPSLPGLEVAASTMILSQCSAVGGAGRDGLAPAPAFAESGRSVTALSGDARSIYRAGAFRNERVPACRGANGVLIYTGGMTFQPSGRAPAFEGFARTDPSDPGFRALGAVVSRGSLSLSLFATKRTPYVLWWSPIAVPRFETGVDGYVWLSPQRFVLELGVMPAPGVRVIAAPYPPGVSGVPVVFQGLHFAGAPRFGAPLIMVLD